MQNEKKFRGIGDDGTASGKQLQHEDLNSEDSSSSLSQNNEEGKKPKL